MLLRIKVYLITIIYVLGALFMTFFPPRNFELSSIKIRKARSTDDIPTFKSYLNHESLLARIGKLARDDPEVTKVLHLSPLTFENRSIVALELRSDLHSKKPGILVIGGLNAMTWGAPNAILELAEKLLYDTNYQTPFFNDYDWYLIPVGNPDGIHFTQNIHSRPAVNVSFWSCNVTIRQRTRPEEWHKNLDRESEKELCFGSNINRNFAYHWQDDVHKTPDRCCQHYPGVRPFSTKEAQAIRKYVDQLGTVVHLAIHLHASYVPKKEYILYPWRYTQRHPSNYRLLQDIGEYAARQARLPDGRLYQVHQGSNDGRVAGSLSDYLSGVVGIDLVYLLKPFHPMYPNITDVDPLHAYVTKATTAILALVRGWRSSTKQNTLSFFGKDEYILYPWRYTQRHPSNYRLLQDIGEYAARQARLPDGRLYQVHQGSNDGRVAGSLSDYLSGVVGIDLVYLLKPFHPMYPNITDVHPLHAYVTKATTAILALVRGWRSSTKQNTLSFFGKDVEF